LGVKLADFPTWDSLSIVVFCEHRRFGLRHHASGRSKSIYAKPWAIFFSYTKGRALIQALKSFEAQKAFNFALFAAIFLIVRPHYPLTILAAALVLVMLRRWRMDSTGAFQFMVRRVRSSPSCRQRRSAAFFYNSVFEANPLEHAGAYLAALAFSIFSRLPRGLSPAEWRSFYSFL